MAALGSHDAERRKQSILTENEKLARLQDGLPATATLAPDIMKPPQTDPHEAQVCARMEQILASPAGKYLSDAQIVKQAARDMERAARMKLQVVEMQAELDVLEAGAESSEEEGKTSDASGQQTNIHDAKVFIRMHQLRNAPAGKSLSELQILRQAAKDVERAEQLKVRAAEMQEELEAMEAQPVDWSMPQGDLHSAKVFIRVEQIRASPAGKHLSELQILRQAARDVERAARLKMQQE
eukprot:COSAG05_NODE_971_length_6368_cov_3.026320_4_plen_239_part_00